MVETGAERFMHRGSHLLAHQGDLSLVNPDVVHTGEPASPAGYVYRAFYPQASFLQNIDPQGTLPYLRYPVVHDPELVQRFLHIHQELTRRFLHSGRRVDLGLETALLEAFHLLLHRHAERKAHHPFPGSHSVARQVQDFLEAHLQDPVRLETLAQVFQMHPVVLVRVFKRQFGLPPHAYQNQRRIDRSRSMLRQGRAVAETALELGFFDQSHFTKHFRRVMGVTPGVYQKAVGGWQTGSNRPIP
ncbi:transcriptional regulator [Deinococcus cellulosilyticus NBRC 106333 = KACC 11606]|uniref:Transcriptional regulator n=2 Tax=Deinococcus cellulosilyticus TaxID=401558 RepID=A0A511N1E8_DEIC1|nr:transcriptional regulator [Deinococcus cellulosilyticus NBRC 106333 = KACC 11606]